MNQANRIRALALAGGILWAGGANATSICELNLIPSLDFTNTGVCGQVITTLDGVQVQDVDESGSVASAAAQQGVNPPTPGSDGTSGTATATYPNPDGTGGSVGASSFVSGGDGASGEISSVSSSFYIGKFIADDGVSGSDLFDLTVNLDISGELFVKNTAEADLFIVFAAVDALGDPLGTGFVGLASLQSFGLFISSPFTDPFALDPSCTDFSNLPQHECTVIASTIENVVLPDLMDGDVFGLFLSIVTIAAMPNGLADAAAYADFANTVDISFTGGNVTALPSTIAAPEPASVALVLAGVLVIGLARTRLSA